MKKKTKGLAFLLTIVMIASIFPIRQPVQADYCEHERDTSVALDYRNNTDDEMMIYTWAKCAKCGEWYVYCDAREHNWAQTDVGNVTCTSDGYYKLECTLCGATVTHITEKAKGHQWGEWAVTREPSCTAEGEQTRTCEECHETETQAIPAAGHQWGEWTQTKAPTADKPGEEKRECEVCHETETRAVDGTGVYAKKGDSCFEVLIAKQLLAFSDKYDGEIDRDFDEGLENALKTFREEKGFAGSGELTKEILQALTEDLAGCIGEDIPADGRLMDFDTGLLVYPVFDSSYTGGGDGTHERTSVLTGIRFRKNGEERSFTLPESMRVRLDTVHEPCLVNNEKHTCPCGYQDLYEPVIADIDFVLKDGVVAVPMNLGIGESGLYIMLDIIYNEEGGYVYWDAVPEAVRYEIVISHETGEGWETYKKLTADTPLFPVGGMPEGSYAVCIQAFNENGEAVSEESYGSFDLKPDGRLFPPQFATLGSGTISWVDMNNLDSTVFIAQLFAYAPGGAEIWKAEKETSGDYADFTKELAVRTDLPAGTVLRGQVAARDLSGKYADSEFAQTNETDWIKPDYYRAETAVNVRSGAGKEYERIGGLSKGDIVPCYGTETGTDGASYLKIGYQGRLAYVSASFLTMFVPVQYSVKVDLGNGITIDVATNPDGTIDVIDFEEQVSLRKNGRIGYRAEGFYLNSKRWDIADPVPENTTLQTKWTEDTACVQIELHYYTGKSEKVYIYIGESYPELKQEDGYIWTTGKNAQGSVFTAATVFTADMNGMKLYQSKLQGTDIVLGKYASHCPDIFRQLYSEGAYPSGSLGTLLEGDRLRIESSSAGQPEKIGLSGGQITISNEWIKVYSYRLDKSGYILAELLKNSAPDYRAVYFDPNGGRMDISSLKVLFDAKKGGYYIGVYPDAVRDGYALAGWADENGTLMSPQKEISKDGLKLTAVWTDEMPYASRTGVTYTSGDTQVKSYDDPDGKRTGWIPIATEVKIIKEKEDKYLCVAKDKTVWINKEDVVTEYNKLRIQKRTDYYSDYTLNIMGKKPKGILYEGEIGYQLDAGLMAYGVLMPPYEDVRPDPMYVWISKRNAIQGFTLYFEPAPGQCNYRSVELRTVTYLDYDNTIVYVRDKGGEVEMLPKARCPGYTFLGWYTDPIGGVPVHVGERLQSNTTVFAHYEGLYDGRLMVATKETTIYEKDFDGEFVAAGTVKPGTVAVIRLNREKENGYYLASFGSESWWIKKNSFSNAKIKTVVGIDEEADPYVREEPKSKGKKYYEIRNREVFVIAGQNGQWYKVVCPESETGFAYAHWEHFRE